MNRMEHLARTVLHHARRLAEPGRHRRAPRRYLRALEIFATRTSIRPTVSILLPVYRVAPELLRETLASVEVQIWPEWQLCIVDDATDDPAIAAVIEAFAASHSERVRHVRNATNLHISRSYNRCFELASGELVTFLDHDDRLLPHALAEVVRAWTKDPRIEWLFSDECAVEADGTARHDPYLKPCWSPLFLLSVNYVNHLCVMHRDLFARLGGFRAGYEGAEDHDLALRAAELVTNPPRHIPVALYDWRGVATSTAASLGAKPYAIDAGRRAVRDACARRGIAAEVEFEPKTRRYRLRLDSTTRPPQVSLIVPWPGALPSDLLEAGVSLEVIAEGADSRGDLASRLNALIERASSEVVIIFPPGVVPLTSQWAGILADTLALPEAGVVGGLLLEPDGRIHAAGLGMPRGRGVRRILRGSPRDSMTYSAYAQTLREVAAVPEFLMTTTRSLVSRLGGFRGAHPSVDFCIRARQLGKVTVFQPQVAATIAEPCETDDASLCEGDDPFWHPNLEADDLIGIVTSEYRALLQAARERLPR